MSNIKCPTCDSMGVGIIDSRSSSTSFSVRRRRECENCGIRFTTKEIIVGAGDCEIEQDDKPVNTIPELPSKAPIGNSYLYVLKSNQFFKIGYTTNLYTRLSQIQIGNPELIECIYHKELPLKRVIELEACLHTLFDSKHKSGEWFELTDNDLELIKQLCSVGTSVNA